MLSDLVEITKLNRERKKRKEKKTKQKTETRFLTKVISFQNQGFSKVLC